MYRKPRKIKTNLEDDQVSPSNDAKQMKEFMQYATTAILKFRPADQRDLQKVVNDFLYEREKPLD